MRVIQYVSVLCFLCVGTTQAKEFIIGVEDVSYYPLYDFSSTTPNKKSFTKELLSTFFEHKGYKFKFVPLPVKRFDKWYLEDAIDFKFPDNVRWRTGQSKKLNIIFSKPVLHLMAGAFVLKKNQSMVREDVKRLGTIFGFFPTLWNDRLKNNTFDLVELHSPYSLTKHLLHGNVDSTNIDKNVIDHNLKLLGHKVNDIVLNEQIKHESYAYHFSSIHYPNIIKEFDDFLSKNKLLVAGIKEKYGIIETYPFKVAVSQ